MVKKKKNRQQDPSLQNGEDSTDSNEENQTNTAGGRSCPHVAKAVDFMKVKKALKPGGLAFECAECLKNGSSTTLKAAEIEGSSAGGLWLCLRCGHQGCDVTQLQHAAKHHLVPHSDCHALVVNTQQWKIWCYECDKEIDPTYSRKVHECVEFLKRLHSPKATKQPIENGNVDIAAEPLVNGPLTDVTNKIAVVASSVEHIKKTILNDLPRVRGLKNLGNTCFFNAVLQCLAQTPFLLPVLEEMKEQGTKFELPGGTHPLLKDGEKLPPLEGELCKWRELTELLVDTLHELRSGRADMLDPRPLLDKLSQRCPQFAGGDQHDAHELLRHLLEEVRTEDLKRYQRAIMANLGIPPKSDPAILDLEQRMKAKAYGLQAQELVLHPEQVFRGLLVSTLECQDCMHHSQRIENFLDLSLPINSDKPQPPVMRKKNSMDSFYADGSKTEDHPSKHQLKKERKMQRKSRKMKRVLNTDPHKSEPTIAEETNSKRNSGESEHSDADVEDNLEQEVSPAPCQNNGESGYSSEKADAGHEDSGGSSPIILGAPLLYDDIDDPNDSNIVMGSLLNNGDSALASPGSPTACGKDAGPLSIIPLSSCIPSYISPSSSPPPLEPISLDAPLRGSPFPDPPLLEQQSLVTPTLESLSVEPPPLVSLSVEPPPLVSLSVEPPPLEIPSPDLLSIEPPPLETLSLEPPPLETPSPDSLPPLETPLQPLEPPEFGTPSLESMLLELPPLEELSHKTLSLEQLKAPPPPPPPSPPFAQSPSLFSSPFLPPSSPVLRSPASPSLPIQLPPPQLGRSDLILQLPHMIPLPPPPPTSSPTGAPSPASSDVSVECACGSPVPDLESVDFGDLEDRPYSRFGFHEADGTAATPNQSVGEETPVVDVCNGMGNLSLGSGDKTSDQTLGTVNGLESCTPPSEKVKEFDGKNRTLAPHYQCTEGECSVLSCLNQFTAIELMTGNNKVGCVNCTQRYNKGKEGKMVCTNSTKQLLISSPPAVLILHLKRFQVHVNTLRKITRHVPFPLVLDLAPICSTKCKESPTVRSDQNQIIYSLYGVVEHSGTLHGGHYVAFVKVRETLSDNDYRWSFVPASHGSRRHVQEPEKQTSEAAAECCTPVPPRGRWYYVSDSRVREVDEEVVMRSQAYMLFYERIW